MSHTNNPYKSHTYLLAGVCAFSLVSAFSSFAFAADDTGAGISGAFAPFVQMDFVPLVATYQTPTQEIPGNRNIQIEPDNNASTAQNNTAKQNALLNARLQLETGHIYDATKLLNVQLAQNPNDIQLLGYTANAENYGGNWPYASYLLNQAHALAPENQDISELLKDIRREHAQAVQADFDWIKYGHSLEDIGTLSGMVNLANHWGAGADIKDNYTMGRDLRLSNGYVGDKNGNKQQGDIYALYSWQNGQTLKASVFGNNETGGGGLYYNFLNPLGATQLIGEYQRPYWDTPAAVLDDAVRDHIGFLHTIKPSTRLSIEGGAGYNIYKVDGTDNALTSINADLYALYRIIDQVKYHSPYVSLGYNINAEFIKTAKFSFDSTGNYTRIFTLNSRDIQTPFVEIGEDLTPRTYAALDLGYQLDLLGGNGPLIEGRITHELNNMFDVQLHAGYSLDTAQSQNNTTTVGGYLRCRF